MKTRYPTNLAGPQVGEIDLERRGSNLADWGLFLRKFLEKGRTISAAVPSSRALVEGALRPLDFSRPATIVELGAGIGPITEQILERLQPHHRFITIEREPEFCDILRRRFPEAAVLEADVAAIGEPLRRMGIYQVDYVVSALPTPNLPVRALVGLWKWLRRALAPDGLFTQVTVAPLIYRSFYDRLFESVEYRMVWRNLPPGGVYCCAHPRRALVAG